MHDHLVEHQRDQGWLEGRLRTGSRSPSLDSDITLVVGNHKAAFGHCQLDFATGLGLCTFSGGIGELRGFQARADVSYLGGPNWAWDGTYTLDSDDD